MTDSRSVLPIGTTIALGSGNTYRISGAPIGWGGGSIIYPAERCVLQSGAWVSDGFSYALKECFPLSAAHTYIRNQQGEICAADAGASADAYLLQAKSLQLQEGELSRSIYKTASRMLPVREGSHKIVLGYPEKAPVQVRNTVTIMESLSEKGRSVRSILHEQRRVALFDTFRIIEQLLFALQEVHQAGFLHLDIQDGNIFLKGSLSDNSQFLTLIDFGSARPMQGRKTAPISDRVIFTSEGFSAPEILLGNDGTLCLTPEADIYSVGCLALYLLTGHRPSSRTLLYTHSGKFLSQSQLSRLKCPRHLTDRLQSILSRALEMSPEKRYHSTEEMLADVSDLIGALRPYRTDLSSVTYDVFISYRHSAVDSAAASTLQRQLENFHIPKDLRKDRQSFRRVFVDEGELSSCADFGQQIREAIKNSGWLIVICSPETPASIWVQQEIDAFLENHDRSRILAVLTSGEPGNSFPPQLKADAEGNGEVLAADARGQNIDEVIRKLKKDALLKVAAPMLGTTFDALKQRRRVQQMKRAITGVSAAVVLLAAFSAYAVNRATVIANQAVRIEEEYRNALMNESRFLTEQAEKHLRDNDPMNALELALKALPSRDQDRPVLPEAEAVLKKVLNITQAPTAASHHAVAVGRVTADTSDFAFDESGKYLITVGRDDNVCQVWDADSLKLLHVLHDGAHLFKPALVPGTTFLIGKTSEGISCVDYVKNEIVWFIPGEGADFCISDDGKTVLVMKQPDQERAAEFLLLSSETGTQIRSIEFALDVPASRLACTALSNEWQWAIISDPSAAEYMLLDLEAICVCSLNKPAPGHSLHGHLFDGDQLVLLWTDAWLGSTLDNYSDARVMEESQCAAECIDLDSGSILWSREYTFMPKDGRYSLDSVTNSLGEGISLSFGNMFAMLDENTGAVLHQAELPDGIMDIQYQDDGFLAICANGSLIRHTYRSSGFIEYKVFDAPIARAVRHEDTVLLQKYADDATVVKYAFNKRSDFYTTLSEMEEWTYTRKWYFQAAPEGIRLLLQGSEKSRFFDESQHTDRIFTIEGQAVSEDPLGLSSDGRYLYTWGNYDSTLLLNAQILKVDLQDGTSQILQTPDKIDRKSLVNDVFLWEDRFWFVLKDLQDYSFALCSFEESEEDIQHIAAFDIGQLSGCPEMDWRWSYLSSSEQLDAEKGHFFFGVKGSCPEEAHAVFVSVDMTTGTARTISAELPSGTELSWGDVYCWNESQTAVFCAYEDMLYLFDQDGQPVSKIAQGTTKVKSVCFVQDDRNILLLYQDGRIDMHRVSDGVKLSSCNLADSLPNNMSSVYIRDPKWGMYRGNRMLSLWDAGFELQVTDTEVKALEYIPEYVGYDPYHDRLVFAGNKTIGVLKLPSLEELIEYGNRILSGEP